MADDGSDRDRVRRLLETNGGRLWQSDLVDETEWSPAKVSATPERMERGIDATLLDRPSQDRLPPGKRTGTE